MDIQDIKSQFQLLSFMVVKLEFNNTFLIYDERKPGKKQIDVAYKICHTDVIEEKNKRIGALDLIINVSSKIDEQEYTLKAIIRGFFDAPDEMSEDTFTQMLRINGCTALYSIGRGIISSISSQTFSFGNVVLPMVNFVRFHELEEQQSNDSPSQA